MVTRRNLDLDKADFSLEEAWARSASYFRRIAADASTRNAIQSSESAMTFLEPAARRFIAGLDRGSALAVSRALAKDSILVSIDFMGEDTHDLEEIEAATQEFIHLIEESAELHIDASASLNLSHIGLAHDRRLAVENCRRIARAASAHGTEVILNMEGDSYRPEILSTFWELGSDYENLGVTLQACLDSTHDALSRSLELPGRIRLVKGAYDELEEGAIRSEVVDRRFRQLSEQLLEAGHRASIATHDPGLLMAIVRSLEETQAQFLEFEMLYGVARRRLHALRDFGYPVRVYLPYGTDWFLYLCHRIAEYPPNVHLAIAEVAPGLVDLLP